MIKFGQLAYSSTGNLLPATDSIRMNSTEVYKPKQKLDACLAAITATRQYHIHGLYIYIYIYIPCVYVYIYIYVCVYTVYIYNVMYIYIYTRYIHTHAHTHIYIYIILIHRPRLPHFYPFFVLHRPCFLAVETTGFSLIPASVDHHDGSFKLARLNFPGS
jgi:hypothetical protein